MNRYIGLHTLPGFTRQMLADATPALENFDKPRFLRAYSSFSEGKVVCEWDAEDKDSVSRAYAELGFPYDEIVLVDAVCDNGSESVDTRYV